MKRRNFNLMAATATVAVTTAALPYGLTRLIAQAGQIVPERHLKPPGAIDDDQLFTRACIACGLCGEICPPKCIQFHRRDGGAQVNIPFINPEQTACTLCGKCMEVCPTEALSVTPREEIDMGVAQIDRSACYPWVDKGICGACVSICPLGERAIGFKFWGQYQPGIKQGCVGCGLCVEVCPHPSLPIRIVNRFKGRVASHSV